MVASGLFIIAAAVAGKRFVVVPTLLVMALVSCGYSYVLYRRLEAAPK